MGLKEELDKYDSNPKKQIQLILKALHTLLNKMDLNGDLAAEDWADVVDAVTFD